MKSRPSVAVCLSWYDTKAQDPGASSSTRQLCLRILLWDPRREPAAQHFLELDDGTLHPLTATSAFTLRRLRLNRPPLVTHRLRKRQAAEELRLLTRYRDLVKLVEELLAQQAALMEEQRELLKEQRELLQLLIGRE